MTQPAITIYEGGDWMTARLSFAWVYDCLDRIDTVTAEAEAATNPKPRLTTARGALRQLRRYLDVALREVTPAAGGAVGGQDAMRFVRRALVKMQDQAAWDLDGRKTLPVAEARQRLRQIGRMVVEVKEALRVLDV